MSELKKLLAYGMPEDEIFEEEMEDSSYYRYPVEDYGPEDIYDIDEDEILLDNCSMCGAEIEGEQVILFGKSRICESCLEKILSLNMDWYDISTILPDSFVRGFRTLDSAVNAFRRMSREERMKVLGVKIK